MANPYEDDDVSDPFREHVDDGHVHRHDNNDNHNPHYHNTDRTQIAQHVSAPATTSGATADATSPLRMSALPIDDATPPSFFSSDAVGKTATGYAGAAAGTAPTTAPAAATTTTTTIPAPSSGTARFWTVEYYQQFFDLTTRQLLWRLTSVFTLLQPPDFLRGRNWHVQSGAASAHDVAVMDSSSGGGGGYTGGADAGRTNDAAATTGTAAAVAVPVTIAEDGVAPAADLYGPFWTCTTLWMTIAVVGHSAFVAAKADYRRQFSRYGYCRYNGIDIDNADKAFAMQYGDANFDFAVCMMACTVVYLCCFGVGTAVWGLMKWKSLPVTLSDTVCLYGYSMVALEVAVLLCAILPNVLQWLVCVIACAWAVAYVLCNFWRMWRATLERRWFTAIVAIVVACHACIALSLKLYFLHYSYKCSTK